MRLKSTLIIYFSLFIILLLAGCSKTGYVANLPAINAANNKNIGESARDLLASTNFNSLKIEIDYMAGYEPDAASVTNLISFLNALTNKPGGITVFQQQITAEGKNSYSVNDIATIEQKNRSAYNAGKELDAYVLIIDGAYSDRSVLGVSYRNTSICLMGKTIFDNSGSVGQVNRTKLESTVIEHEFGHLLGLVNVGSPMSSDHEDTAHANHCNIQSCLMYYAAETTDFFLGFLVELYQPSILNVWRICMLMAGSKVCNVGADVCAVIKVL